MSQKIISNITSVKNNPKAHEFVVVFIDRYNNSVEFFFIGNSLSQCVNQCTGLINYMFRYSGMEMVYIFPTICIYTHHNVYAQRDGYPGEYKIIKCLRGVHWTLDDIKSQFTEF